jgi:hypothetical protein
LVKFTQRRRRLAEAEVAAPPDEVGGQLLDDLREAFASGPARQFPHPASESSMRLWRDAPPRLLPVREAKAQELALGRSVDRARRLVDPELGGLDRNLSMLAHHAFAGPLTANIDVAVVGITNEV